MAGDESKRGASKRHIMTAVEDSLQRLKTDWIDLYQLHEPDPATPLEETLRALDDLVHQGKVRFIGCSNLPAWQVVDSLWIAEKQGLKSFVSCQDEFSLIERKPTNELIPAIEAHGLGLLPYFPLASGLLTGKYRGGSLPEGARITGSPRLKERVMTADNIRIADSLDRYATQKGHTLLELAFGWLLAHRVVSSVIAGATKPEQIQANVAAAGWELTAEELAEVGLLFA
jgi:aryl-alcohol dehydrogenase-like predicted oxidoreductase